MQRSDERILTTHTGSLPRPEHLTALFAARAAGETIDETELAEEGALAVADVVRRQLDAGIDVGNDGEQSREAFFLYVQRRMSGFAPGGIRPGFQDVERHPDFKAMRTAYTASRRAVSNQAPPKVTGEVRYLDRALIEAECREFRTALDAAAPATFVETFLTAPSPGIVAAAVPNEHYDTFDRYLKALTDALAIEYRTIVEQGFLLQLDCPDLALERHVLFQDRPLSEFVDFVEAVVDAINGALVGIPRDRVRLHVCWGNYEGPHDCDVPLADIVRPILQAKAGALLLPFANARHSHEIRCLEGGVLDDDQLLIAGVIDTTTNYVEHPEVVAERLERAARTIGDPRRVLAGTDCGFDTSAGMGRVAPGIVWAKLAAMVEGARIASTRLFPNPK